MIEARQVMPLLLEACPSFSTKWAEVEVENADDTEPTGGFGFVDAGNFIRHMVSLRIEGQTSEFPAIFEVIERLLVEGDPYLQNLAVIGYLEGFQMMTVTSAGLDPERDFRPWLRPVSESWWQRINRLWAGDASALRDADGTP